MKICLIGKNLSNFVLASVLINKNLDVDIIYNMEPKKNKTRTLAISNDNFSFLVKIDKKMKLSSWPVSAIKIFNEKKKNELFHFKNKNKNIFFLLNYNHIYDKFYNILKNSKRVKIKKLKNKITENYLLNKKNYKLIINSDKSCEINKRLFYKKIKKSYDSFAYTTIVKHKKVKNKVAFQIFTNSGPLAFLPLSTTNTSIVFSVINKNKKSENQILELVKKYNFHYDIESFSKFEKFKLNFSMLRKYYFRNILSFGDLLHTIHPMAGQGFNMTIRDVRILSNLIEKKLEIGLDLNSSIFEEFQSKTKHLNFIFGSGIDCIHNFFIFDSKLKNNLSIPLFSFLEKNKYLNKYATFFANKGLVI